MNCQLKIEKNDQKLGIVCLQCRQKTAIFRYGLFDKPANKGAQEKDRVKST
jgi:hypothetical protein